LVIYFSVISIYFENFLHIFILLTTLFLALYKREEVFLFLFSTPKIKKRLGDYKDNTTFFLLLLINLYALNFFFPMVPRTIGYVSVLAILSLSFSFIFILKGKKTILTKIQQKALGSLLSSIVTYLEVFGLYLKALTLTTRLVINIIAGHAILSALAHLFPSTIVILLFEIIVCSIQAFIFIFISQIDRY